MKEKKYKCSQCEHYEKEAKKYKRKYEIAKSGLSNEERDILCDLICNEQIKYHLKNGEYNSDRYILLEQLKAKIKVI